jgi:hypothetical protein
VSVGPAGDPTIGGIYPGLLRRIDDGSVEPFASTYRIPPSRQAQRNINHDRSDPGWTDVRRDSTHQEAVDGEVVISGVR